MVIFGDIIKLMHIYICGFILQFVYMYGLFLNQALLADSMFFKIVNNV